MNPVSPHLNLWRRTRFPLENFSQDLGSSANREGLDLSAQHPDILSIIPKPVVLVLCSVRSGMLHALV